MRRKTVAFYMIGGLAAAAGPARAADHLMRVNEVMLSTGGDGTAQFVELRDPSAEPLLNGPYRLEVYDADGALIDSVTLTGIFGAAPYLVSSAAADDALGSNGNAVLDFLLPGDGQACFVRANGSKIHCLAWGCVDTLATAAASRGPSPADGESLQRQADGTYQLAAPTAGEANVPGTAAEACSTIGADAGPDATPGPDAAPGQPDAAAVDEPDAAQPPPDSGDDGCGCRVARAGASATPGLWALGMLALGLALARRRP